VIRVQGQQRRDALEVGVLLTSVLVIAICGLLYELLIGSLSSYLSAIAWRNSPSPSACF
jgi:predicted membrane-bound spermidine synthase